MPARKSSAKKSSKKTSVKRGVVVLYAPPIHDAIKRGNLAEMKTLAAQARKHIAEVSAALTNLEKRIGKK